MRLLASLIVVALVPAVGCHGRFEGGTDADPDGPGDADLGDAEVDAEADRDADRVRDADQGRDAETADGDPDEPGADADPDRHDADEDGEVEPGPCDLSLDGVVALYRFEETSSPATLTDATGLHHGAVVDGALGRVEGPDGCGQALALPGSGRAIGLVSDSPAWDLAQGSIDFWVRFDRVTANLGIVSRDANGTALSGHVTLFRIPEGALVARLQSVDSMVHLCSAPVPVGSWIHVGLNFGPPRAELFVNGTLAVRTDSFTFDPDASPTRYYSCGGEWVLGIAGNDNPWVVGASAASSDEGSAYPVFSWFRDGAIDHLRISSIRRDFSTFGH